MNGYFMGDRQLSSEVVPKWKVHKGMFLQPRKHKKGKEENPIVTMESNIDSDTKSALRASASLMKKHANSRR